MTDAFDSVSRAIEGFVVVRRPDLMVRGELLLGTHYGILLVTDTDRARDVLYSDKPFIAELSDFARALCHQKGIYLECVSFTSRESIEREDTADWMVDWRYGWCPQVTFETPPKSFGAAPPTAQGSPPSVPQVPLTLTHRLLSFAKRQWVILALIALIIVLVLLTAERAPSVP